MKNSQRGFVPVIVILTILLISGGAWFYFAGDFQDYSKKAGIVNEIKESEISLYPEEKCQTVPYIGEVDESIKDILNFSADIRGGVLCSFVMHKDLPSYLFHFYGGPANILTKADIFDSSTRQLIQTLDISSDIPSSKDVNDFISADDLNFDGHKDLMIEAWRGATGNVGYAVYLLNSSTKRFEFNETFSNVVGNSKLDRVNKTITTSSNWCAMCYAQYTYKVEGNNLVLIRTERQDGTWGSSFTKVIMELKNGVMATTSIERVEE